MRMEKLKTMKSTIENQESLPASPRQAGTIALRHKPMPSGSKRPLSSVPEGGYVKKLPYVAVPTRTRRYDSVRRGTHSCVSVHSGAYGCAKLLQHQSKQSKMRMKDVSSGRVSERLKEPVLKFDAPPFCKLL